MRDETGAVAGGPMFELPQLCRYFSELSPQPMVAVEGTTHIVRYVNDAFALLVGTRRADLIGRPFCEAVPEGEDNGCVALLDRVYFTGKSEKLVEQHHTSRTPPAYWTYAVWAMLGLDDRPLGVIIQVTAVTETAIFRKQVTQMNEALVLSSVRQHQLTATADDLNVSLKASEVEYRRLFETSEEQASVLSDLHRRKDEFLAMLSHELRNPLTPIANAAQLLRLQLDESPLQQQARAIIERQVGQMTRLIDDLMEVSRITSGRIHLQRERLDLRRIVERARESVDPLVVEHQHVLTLRLPPDPVWLNADATRLEQVLVNLLNNAAKYSDDHSHIWLGLEQEGAEAVLRVHDSGIGIAPHVLPRIFDLFTQAERTLDRSQGGLGIGLALVKELVTMHGGTVEAISALGQGSEFVVRLPIFDCRLPIADGIEGRGYQSKFGNRNSKIPPGPGGRRQRGCGSEPGTVVGGVWA